MEENPLLQLLKSCLLTIDGFKRQGSQLLMLSTTLFHLFSPLLVFIPLCACPYLTRASLSSGAIRATCRFASKCMSAVRPQISINCVSSWALAERGPVFVQNTHTEPEKQRREQWYLTNTSADALMYICALKRELDSSCAACLHRST